MTLSGLDGSLSYSCQAPEGVRCESVSGNYANANANALASGAGERQAQAQGPRPSAQGAWPQASTPSARRPTLPGRESAGATSADSGSTSSPAAPGDLPTAQVPAAPQVPLMPQRSPERILRLWFKAWEDADRDLYDQGYIYVRVEGGQWRVDHVQRQIRDAYAPLRPPLAASAAPSPSSPSQPAAGPTARPTVVPPNFIRSPLAPRAPAQGPRSPGND